MEVEEVDNVAGYNGDDDEYEVGEEESESLLDAYASIALNMEDSSFVFAVPAQVVAAPARVPCRFGCGFIITARGATRHHNSCARNRNPTN